MHYFKLKGNSVKTYMYSIGHFDIFTIKKELKRKTRDGKIHWVSLTDTGRSDPVLLV